MTGLEIIRASIDTHPVNRQGLKGALVSAGYTDTGADSLLTYWLPALVRDGEITYVIADGVEVYQTGRGAAQAPTEKIIRIKSANDTWREAINQKAKE